MGAVKLATDYITSPSNNASYVGSGAVKQVIQTATTSASGSLISSALGFAGRVATRFNPYIFAGSVLYDIGSSVINSLSKEEKAQLSEPELVAYEHAENIAKNIDYTKQKNEALKEKVQTIDNSVVYEQGQSLPSVLSQNAKALTQSINTLTSTVSEQLGLLNNYMMAFAIYQQQFLDIKASEADLKIESMEFAKTAKTVKDLDGQEIASFSPREAELVKNATLAKDTTDEINFELPPEFDADLSSDKLDISSILGYDDGSDIYKEFFTRMGGVGL